MANNNQLPKMPNGFRCWMETFYEVVSYIERANSSPRDSYIKKVREKEGTTGLYDLAEQWTNEFEELNEGRQWDGEFFDEVEDFCTDKDMTSAMTKRKLFIKDLTGRGATVTTTVEEFLKWDECEDDEELKEWAECCEIGDEYQTATLKIVCVI